MVRRVMAAVAGSLVLLTGLFLALAPFALVQRTDRPWRLPTTVTVASAAVLAVLGLVVALASIGGLLAEVHARYPDTVRKQPKAPKQAAQPAPAAPGDGDAVPTRTVPLASVIEPMIAAYQKDLAARGPETPLDAMLGKMLTELSAAGADQNGAAVAAGQDGGAVAGQDGGAAAAERFAAAETAGMHLGRQAAGPAAPEAPAEQPEAGPGVTGRAENVVYIGRARVPGSTDRPDPAESLAAEGEG